MVSGLFASNLLTIRTLHRGRVTLRISSLGGWWVDRWCAGISSPWRFAWQCLSWSSKATYHRIRARGRIGWIHCKIHWWCRSICRVRWLQLEWPTEGDVWSSLKSWFPAWIISKILGSSYCPWSSLWLLICPSILPWKLQKNCHSLSFPWRWELQNRWYIVQHFSSPLQL